MDFIEVSAKTVDDAITESLVKLGTTSDKIEYEVIEKGSSGFLGIGSRPAIIKVRKKSEIEDYVYDFLHSVFQAMEMDVEILINKSEDGKIVDVELQGEEMGVLIGKRGQTLDSLQYLTNLAVGKQGALSSLPYKRYFLPDFPEYPFSVFYNPLYQSLLSHIHSPVSPLQDS